MVKKTKRQLRYEGIKKPKRNKVERWVAVADQPGHHKKLENMAVVRLLLYEACCGILSGVSALDEVMRELKDEFGPKFVIVGILGHDIGCERKRKQDYFSSCLFTAIEVIHRWWIRPPGGRPGVLWRVESLDILSEEGQDEAFRSFREMREQLKRERREPTHVVCLGGPPCQDNSRAKARPNKKKGRDGIKTIINIFRRIENDMGANNVTSIVENTSEMNPEQKKKIKKMFMEEGYQVLEVKPQDAGIPMRRNRLYALRAPRLSQVTQETYKTFIAQKEREMEDPRYYLPEGGYQLLVGDKNSRRPIQEHEIDEFVYHAFNCKGQATDDVQKDGITVPIPLETEWALMTGRPLDCPLLQEMREIIDKGEMEEDSMRFKFLETDLRTMIGNSMCVSNVVDVISFSFNNFFS